MNLKTNSSHSFKKTFIDIKENTRIANQSLCNTVKPSITEIFPIDNNQSFDGNWIEIQTDPNAKIIFSELDGIYNKVGSASFKIIKDKIGDIFDNDSVRQFLTYCNQIALVKYRLTLKPLVYPLDSISKERWISLCDEMLSSSFHCKDFNKGFVKNKAILSLGFYKCMQLILKDSFCYECAKAENLIRVFVRLYYSNLCFANDLDNSLNRPNQKLKIRYINQFLQWTSSICETHNIDLKTLEGIAHYFYHVMEREKDFAFGFVIVNALLRWNKLPLFFMEDVDFHANLRVQSPEHALFIIQNGQEFLKMKLRQKPNFSNQFFDLKFIYQ